MLKVGLTGGIASGKSTVAGMFRELGAHIIDADEVARRIVEPGRPALREIVEAFGPGILKPDGTLDRAGLGRIVFNDKRALERLNAITHPRIWEEEARLFERLREEDPHGIAIVDAAVLIESGAADRVELIIVVEVDEADQLKRLVGQGLSREDALSRIRAQLPLAEKLKYADHVIDNRGSLRDTRRRVKEIWADLRTKSRQKKIDKK